VVGVDRSAAMLAELERKLALEPPEVRELVSWSQGDYRGSDAGGPYATVLWPFNALHHCADEAELGAMFERIAAWVPPAGRLALDAYLPDPELYRRDPAGRYEQRTFLHPTTGETLESWEEGWWDGEHTVHHVVYVYRRPGGSEHRTHLQLRMFSLAQLRSLLAGAGWRILREWKDFRGTLLGPDALKWVAVAERR
jgi:hypothetical protein